MFGGVYKQTGITMQLTIFPFDLIICYISLCSSPFLFLLQENIVRRCTIRTMSTIVIHSYFWNFILHVCVTLWCPTWTFQVGMFYVYWVLSDTCSFNCKWKSRTTNKTRCVYEKLRRWNQKKWSEKQRESDQILSHRFHSFSFFHLFLFSFRLCTDSKSQIQQMMTGN